MTKPGLMYVVAALAGGALGVFGYAVIAGSKAGTFSVSVGDASVEMELQEGQVPFFEIINTLFATEEHKLATEGILEGKYGYYRMDSPALLSEIRDMTDASAVLRENVVDMLRNHQGPFAKDEGFNFRDVSKVETIDDMDRLLGHEHPVADRIRDICGHGEGICKPIGHRVYISAPAGGLIRKGHGAVCKNSRNLGKAVQLTNANSAHMVVVDLRNHFYPCFEDAGRGVDKENFLQLSERDWDILFSNVAGAGILEATMYTIPPDQENSIPNNADRYPEVSNAN